MYCDKQQLFIGKNAVSSEDLLLSEILCVIFFSIYPNFQINRYPGRSAQKQLLLSGVVCVHFVQYLAERSD